ncbi:HMCN [Mytilus coruscus]|uniref:HMCN n=1 Tax=Mytilus coruscus TaxID=42192 RepID=A0A6J8EWU1_MYTCO|nr:HMCN [Mytilus coruscus]
MTYTISEGFLRLRCKIDNLKFGVLFSDPDNNEQAFCLPSYSSTLCHHHYSNSSINQNLFTNETVFTIRGQINANVNGKWICRHGNNFERATVDVKVDSITEVKGLDITANQTLPFSHGTIVEIICAVQITGRYVELAWDCVNITSAEMRVLNCSAVLSKIIYKASIVDNGSFCKCIAKSNRLLTSTSIKLNIETNFDIQLVDRMSCNIKNPVLLYCGINQSQSGFAPWIHSYNGMLIRYCRGVQNGSGSVISMNSCAWKDAGQYTCRAWIKEGSQIIWKNKTTSLIISGPPYVTKANLHWKSYLILSVRFICIPPPESIDWYMEDMLIQNHTDFKRATSPKIVSLDSYGNEIGVDGYVATITLQNAKWTTSYEIAHVVIENMLGNITHLYNLKTGQEDITAGSIYYAAPGSNNHPNVYNDIQNQTEEENNGNNDHQYFEIENVQVDTDKDSNGSRFSLSQSHYIDVDII